MQDPPQDNRSGAGVDQHGDKYYGPIYDSVVGATIVDGKVTVFDLLDPYTVRDALYNSGKRAEEHASTCHADTRTRILENIRQWVNGAGHPVCWLHGPAGTGKSTIAHTTAERCEENEQLAGTFFFSRRKGDREDINMLVPTLAYQIAESIPPLQEYMKQVLQKNRTLLSQNIRQQFIKLIAKPVENIVTLDRSLIVVDGLDECAKRDQVIELIKLLGEMMNTQKFPLRFLLTSRPEADIEAAFRSCINSDTVLWLALEDSRNDVRNYLKTKLVRIRQKFELVMKDEPLSWPPESDLERMVVLSEGLFIHASTAVQYIGDGRGSPQRKLQTVLKMHKGLDSLYTQVISDAQESDNLDTVLGSLVYLQAPLTVRQLGWLLKLDICDIRMALDRCHSILVIPSCDDKSIRPYHASLWDFLSNQERSQSLLRSPAEYHGDLLIRCLENISNAHMSDVWPLVYAVKAWCYHGSWLLFNAAANEQFRIDTEEDAKRIDSKWLTFWVTKASCVVELKYLKLDLPKVKPKVHQTLYLRLKDIKKILNDKSSQHTLSHKPHKLDVVDTNIIILIVGRTGSGISTFINVATGQDIVKVGGGLDPITTEIQAIPIRDPKDPGRRVVFIDTPGFDGYLSNEELEKNIVRWLETSFMRKVSGTICIADLSRFGIGINMMPFLKDHVSTILGKNIVLVTRDRALVEPDIARKQGEALEHHFRDDIDKGLFRMARYASTYDSAWEIIDNVINKANPVTLNKKQGAGGGRYSKLKELSQRLHFL